jgi:cell division protein FtsB
MLLILYGEKGYADLIQSRKERDHWIAKNAKLYEENQSLLRAIDRLKSDPKYIENVAREELGMVRKDEVIFKFKKKGRPQK